MNGRAHCASILLPPELTLAILALLDVHVTALPDAVAGATLAFAFRSYN